MTTVEEAFAAWRIEHPGEHGWPLDAFKAGWEAAGGHTEPAPEPIHYGGLKLSVDHSLAGEAWVICRHRGGRLEILAEGFAPAR